MAATTSRNDDRVRRHSRVREKISGTAKRPRLAVYRSLTNVYAQLIDDLGGRTLASASTLDVRSGSKIERAKTAGERIAERAKAAGIEEVVFDRGGYRYHGRVKALADAARAKGLRF